MKNWFHHHWEWDCCDVWLTKENTEKCYSCIYSCCCNCNAWISPPLNISLVTACLRLTGDLVWFDHPNEWIPMGGVVSRIRPSLDRQCCSWHSLCPSFRNLETLFCRLQNQNLHMTVISVLVVSKFWCTLNCNTCPFENFSSHSYVRFVFTTREENSFHHLLALVRTRNLFHQSVLHTQQNVWLTKWKDYKNAIHQQVCLHWINLLAAREVMIG